MCCMIFCINNIQHLNNIDPAKRCDDLQSKSPHLVYYYNNSKMLVFLLWIWWEHPLEMNDTSKIYIVIKIISFKLNSMNDGTNEQSLFLITYWWIMINIRMRDVTCGGNKKCKHLFLNKFGVDPVWIVPFLCVRPIQLLHCLASAS